LGQRERLRNPALDHFCVCHDRWLGLMKTRPCGSWDEIERAHAEVMRALDVLDVRGWK
jgi:hypothetical protein